MMSEDGGKEAEVFEVAESGGGAGNGSDDGLGLKRGFSSTTTKGSAYHNGGTGLVDNGGFDSDEDDDDVAAAELVCCGRFPKSVPFLIGQEFCERFSYYGLRAILVLYFTNFFGFSDTRATVLYHVFIMLSYLTTVFGGILADSSLGKFRTILYLSCVYFAGNTVMAVTAIPSVAGDPPNWAGAMIGLLLIAIGTGGIKPCVSAFGGDQFGSSQQHLLQTFFAAFYFSINAGSTLSMIITPKLRADVHCYGNDECYPVAFGLPAVLMAIATAVFVFGRSMYRIDIPERNVILEFAKVLKVGFMHKFFPASARRAAAVSAVSSASSSSPSTRSPSPPPLPTTAAAAVGALSPPSASSTSAAAAAAASMRPRAAQHWLDPARDRFGDAFVNDVRQALSVFVVFIPAPLFWTLFDQQGSRWTLQAEQMRMFDMGPLGRFRPDQMQAANAILVLMLIPVFERFVYPALKRLRIPHSPLQRMISGMVLCGVAFVVSGLLQVRIDAAKPDLSIHHGFSNLRIVNFAGTDVSAFITGDLSVSTTTAATSNTRIARSDYHVGHVYGRSERGDVLFGGKRMLDNETLADGTATRYTRVPATGADVRVVVPGFPAYTIINLTLSEAARHSVHVFVDSGSGALAHVLTADHSVRSWVNPNDEDGRATTAAEDSARIKFVNLTPLDIQITREKSSEGNKQQQQQQHGHHGEVVAKALAARNATTYSQGVFDSGRLTFQIRQVGANGTVVANLTSSRVTAEDGADYTVAVRWNGTHASTTRVTDVPGNSVSVLLQLPQYVVMSCGEILFSITGLEFAFSEAPGSMKAVVQAAWQLTVAIGSLIVIIVAESSFFSRQRDEFFFFAGVMGVVCLIFVYIAQSYRYRNPLYRDTTSTKGSAQQDTTPLIDREDSEDAASTSFA
ncbi:oligopeptide transporter [Salpingoeca rosetta]|uniref:Oligopeptide transporter n=1 Tax=Salpingoeca rosetta (strain ATCC 50818 / BSB-021) TaxID=946362 RepID=F2UG63_SALR5|nr:oligopeptide transporter [Salpingoeca rosetta]EGD75491.1 oligopeptide transporter [Salpingoeca rosetta]|eukprot:XP_004991948.1 oligopeptide transporter [Salpingoeca rosetta]